MLNKSVPSTSITSVSDQIQNNSESFSEQNFALQEKIDTLLQKLSELSNKIDSIENILSEGIDLICKTIIDNNEKLTLASQKRTGSIPNTDIKQQLFDLAGRETAEFVIHNMPKCKTFQSANKLREFALSQVKIDGLYLEFGVFSGKTINQAADLKPDQTIFGFDSFEGLPETWRTGFYKNAFARNDIPTVRENVKLIKGWFDDTLPEFCTEHDENCAYIHVDCDLYSSSKIVFSELKHKIVPGTIIVFDEYFNYPSWQEHEYKAFQEFVEETGIEYDYIGYVPSFEQVAVKIMNSKGIS